jgi:hypothetical protein
MQPLPFSPVFGTRTALPHHSSPFRYRLPILSVFVLTQAVPGPHNQGVVLALHLENPATLYSPARRNALVLSQESALAAAQVLTHSSDKVVWKDITPPAALAQSPDSVGLFDNTPNTAGDSILLLGALGKDGTGSVFRFNSTNTTWSRFGNNLPNVLVTDVKYIGGATDMLLVGTFGRGTWTLANASTYLAPEAGLERGAALGQRETALAGGRPGIARAIPGCRVSRGIPRRQESVLGVGDI